MKAKKKLKVIAEAGVNHNGSLARALEMIDVAKEAGADAIKFQSFRADEVVTREAPTARYQKRSTSHTTQLELLRGLQISKRDHEKLVLQCSAVGLEFLSTPFDSRSLRLLVEGLGLKTIKLSSGDLTNGPLLLECARYGVSVILSTGMAVLSEVEEALAVLAFGYIGSGRPSRERFVEAYASRQGFEGLQEKVTLLHCTTEYPCPPDEVNLKAMVTMREAFGLKVGYSDHTAGIVIPIAAAALGAAIVEKHFTLDRGLPGPDHASSLEPVELTGMVAAIREAEAGLGSGVKAPSRAEWANRGVVRRSVVARRKILAGEKMSLDNLTMKRPGTGIAGVLFWEILGKRARRKYEKGEMLEW